MKTTYLTAFAFLSLAACSAGTSPAPAPSPSATGTSTAGLAPSASPVCPEVATNCPEGCSEGKARTYSPLAKCVSKNFDVVVTCNAPELQTSDPGCGVRRADGLVLFGSGSFVYRGADPCSEDIRRAATEAPFCP
jgi:hypothetical protein